MLPQSNQCHINAKLFRQFVCCDCCEAVALYTTHKVLVLFRPGLQTNFLTTVLKLSPYTFWTILKGIEIVLKILQVSLNDLGSVIYNDCSKSNNQSHDSQSTFSANIWFQSSGLIWKTFGVGHYNDSFFKWLLYWWNTFSPILSAWGIVLLRLVKTLACLWDCCLIVMTETVRFYLYLFICICYNQNDLQALYRNPESDPQQAVAEQTLRGRNFKQKHALMGGPFCC